MYGRLWAMNRAKSTACEYGLNTGMPSEEFELLCWRTNRLTPGCEAVLMESRSVQQSNAVVFGLAPSVKAPVRHRLDEDTTPIRRSRSLDGTEKVKGTRGTGRRAHIAAETVITEDVGGRGRV